MSNFASYYEATSDLFMKIGRLCPLFDEYLMLYQSSTRLRKSLIEFHTSIIYCCKHVVQAVQRPCTRLLYRSHPNIALTNTGRKQLLQAFWSSFEQEFEQDIKTIRSRSDDVKEEIALAQAQINAQEQQLQAMERENASLSRSVATKFFSRSDTRLKKLHEWEIQKNARKIREHSQPGL